MKHDHSHHDMHHGMGGHDAMKMWFHGGCKEVILFEFWRIDSYLGLLLSCVIIFVMGILYEGVKWIRVYLQLLRASSNKGQTASSHNRELDRLQNNAEFGPSSTHRCHSRIHQRNTERNVPSFVFSIAQVLLYCVQFILAYFLMLIVMSYNTWLTIAVIGAAAFGHWLFTIIIPHPNAAGHDSFTSDGCH